jgi:ribokinase
MKPVVVVGSMNVDLVARAERIPMPGETVPGTRFAIHSGGKGANQAVAVARLGCPCIFLSRQGNDVFGPQLVEGLQAAGVDTAQIDVTGNPSGTALIVVEENGQNCIVVTPGANADVTVEYLETKQETLRSAAMVLTQLEIPLATVEWLAQFCHAEGVPLVLDPAPARELPASLFPLLDWFTPNETEAAFYAGGEAGEEVVLGRLFAMGLRSVVLKQGAQGALLAKASGYRERIAPFVVEAVDTTAAGDVFNGAFAAGLTQGRTEVESAQMAAAAAALSVTRAGAQPSMPTAQEVQAALERESG